MSIYTGPVVWVITSLMAWYTIFKIVTDGRDWSGGFVRGFRLASLPIAVTLSFGGLAFVAENKTSEMLIVPTLQLFGIQ